MKFLLVTVRTLCAACTLLLTVSAALGDAMRVTIVPFPDTTRSNAFYTGNRAPLLPARLIELPIGAVQPRGWLRETLRRQSDGLCGHLDEISVWLQKSNNAWLSPDGKGQYGWEEVPYWLRGYLQLAYINNDPKMIVEGETWINGALHSQRPDGDFGPDQRFQEDGSRDFWANMLMLYCLETYYEHSHDPRVLDLMTKYFRFQLTVPDAKFLTHYWQKMRGGDNLYSVYWLYNRTGEPFLLDLAQKIHRCTANWEMNRDLPNWHNVNIAESFREPAEHYLQTHQTNELQDTYADFREVRRRFGQVPGGMFGGDENCRAGYTDPHQAIETCGMVEQMFSDELLLAITGDCAWADNCEDVAFNSYPAALMPDLRSLRYLTAPNMVLSDAANHSPGLDNGGPFLLMNPFSSRCCQHNHSMGWPAFDKHLWFATPDNGLCAALYSASEVTAQVRTGATVKIEEQTRYPFDEDIQLVIHTAEATTFPLYLRIPGWCHYPSLAVNKAKIHHGLPPDQFVRIEREWKDNDTVTLHLPGRVSVEYWPGNHNSVSVRYGALTFSLKIGELYLQRDSAKTAIGDSGWQKTANPAQWPSFEIDPSTPWNYALVLDARDPAKTFKVKHLAGHGDFPFAEDTCPIQIEATGKRLPSWTMDACGLCGALQNSPVASKEAVEIVTLIPMGAARLRVSAFPWLAQ